MQGNSGSSKEAAVPLQEDAQSEAGPREAARRERALRQEHALPNNIDLRGLRTMQEGIAAELQKLRGAPAEKRGYTGGRLQLLPRECPVAIPTPPPPPPTALTKQTWDSGFPQIALPKLQ